MVALLEESLKRVINIIFGVCCPRGANGDLFVTQDFKLGENIADALHGIHRCTLVTLRTVPDTPGADVLPFWEYECRGGRVKVMAAS